MKISEEYGPLADTRQTLENAPTPYFEFDELYEQGLERGLSAKAAATEAGAIVLAHMEGRSLSPAN